MGRRLPWRRGGEGRGEATFINRKVSYGTVLILDHSHPVEWRQMSAGLKTENRENGDHYEVQMLNKEEEGTDDPERPQRTVLRAEENSEPQSLGLFLC